MMWMDKITDYLEDRPLIAVVTIATGIFILFTIAGVFLFGVIAGAIKLSSHYFGLEVTIIAVCALLIFAITSQWRS